LHGQIEVLRLVSDGEIAEEDRPVANGHAVGGEGPAGSRCSARRSRSRSSSSTASSRASTA
ncbi:MAG: hypothetical protein ACHQ3O_09950, partial [Candidatus Limnocylindria bacterium]